MLGYTGKKEVFSIDKSNFNIAVSIVKWSKASSWRSSTLNLPIQTIKSAKASKFAQNQARWKKSSEKMINHFLYYCKAAWTVSWICMNINFIG